MVLGGARSGKSGFAQERVCELASLDDPVYYVATAFIKDDEMARRVERHRSDRPDGWITLEAQREVHKAIERLPVRSILLLDCVTMMITNFMFDQRTDWDDLSKEDEDRLISSTLSYVDQVLMAIRGRSIKAVLVSNEVGMGLVPPYPLGRIFRDIAGWVNQAIAKEADSVFLLTAGIPQRIKGEPR
ncbi:bifunctional adenosylcobinamide kinase/adenosylcobinamide-phosphate guanylyltransferase [Dethiosulfovibrio salsuginis]|uniref:Adenosylcobinamide kinase n=1 Tax=Dethiosulfovibrio salsuginis TaxID=561720 RepID=A0A1X7JME4_9BACT|nr:bifunctional adenosylcobinamide kinase/adenosylcobinamide-phosphate guanylyltransferase [Dethiosulfovibrio salsuginis]SMG29039.1 adenosylcobinamide kinase /adenosylcobinamide-phosphate guanylyltransferase [Dethiosulfovibrio salsuginis]